MSCLLYLCICGCRPESDPARVRSHVYCICVSVGCRPESDPARVRSQGLSRGHHVSAEPQLQHTRLERVRWPSQSSTGHHWTSVKSFHSWPLNFLVWWHWTCYWTHEFVNFYDILLKYLKFVDCPTHEIHKIKCSTNNIDFTVTTYSHQILKKQKHYLKNEWIKQSGQLWGSVSWCLLKYTLLTYCLVCCRTYTLWGLVQLPLKLNDINRLV